MNRRAVIIGAAAGLFGCASKLDADPPLTRGLWRDAQGPFALGRFHEFGDGDFAFDYTSLRVCLLAHRAAGSAQISGSLDGSVTAVGTVVSEGSDLQFGTRHLKPIPIERRAFDVPSDGLVLSAELATIKGTRSRGTVLMIYGSGPAPKEAFDLWAFWFLGQGYSVLTYDKRGSGRSTGDWRTSGLEALASDATSVLRAARRYRPAKPIIGWGASQAGWILPQLSAAGLLDSVIMHAGSAMRPREQILGQVDAELRAYGFPENEIARAISYYALDVDVSCGTRAWADVDAAYKAAAAAGAEWLLGPPAAADAPERTMIRLMANFDPQPYWALSRAPLLALFGGKDWIVPAKPNLVALKKMVGSDVDFRAVIFPQANHLMFVAETGLRDEYASRSHLDQGYFSTIENWLSNL